MIELNQVYNEDCLDTMKRMPDGFVDCVVCSPPYWGLRVYKCEPKIWDGSPDCEHEWAKDFCTKCGAWKGTIGNEPSFELYIVHLLQIFAEVKRVLKKTGTLWVNLGDTYPSGGGKATQQSAKRKKGIENEVYPDDTVQSKLRTKQGKCLLQIP